MKKFFKSLINEFKNIIWFPVDNRPINDGSKCVCEYYHAQCTWCHDRIAEESC